MRGALSYNEHKVREGNADLILASQFGCEINDLGLTEKLNRFEKLTQNSTKVLNNTLHISLNFSPDDKLDVSLMQNIAADYMKQLGFGSQPFLVYRHDDTTHPHIHILTTPIKTNGRSIYLHNLAKRKSEPARKAIEGDYNLIKAEGRKKSNILPFEAVNLEAAGYGKTETKRTISNIVSQVVSQYKYDSLLQLNAVLRQFNIVADPGSPESFRSKHQGLVYNMVDNDGEKIGIPIKASDIYGSPILKKLEKQFPRNRVRKVAAKRFTQNSMEYLINRSRGRSGFMDGLREKNIGCTILRNGKGTIEEITFIDHRFRSAFSAQELGYNIPELLRQINHSNSKDKTVTDLSTREDGIASVLFKTLFAQEYPGPELSAEFLKKKRKKRKQ